MSSPAWIKTLTQWALIITALAMMAWIRAPAICIAGIALVGTTLAAARFTKKSLAVTIWASSALVWAGCVTTNVWYTYFAIVAALIAAALWVDGVKRKSATMTWALLSGVICIGAGYAQNQAGPFYFGIFETVALIIILRACFRVRPVGVQLLNTILLVLIGLPIADFFVRPNYRLGPQPQTYAKFYSYEDAQGDPRAFARWWRYFPEQANSARLPFFERLPTDNPGFRLKPSSHGLLLQSSVSIDAQGFRGPEVPAEKGDAYRIVALGESTTFGMTIYPQDRPWPELLEQMIRERIKTTRPVQVINAGVPAYNIENNIKRLSGQILSVRPDMIISYHGFNAFDLINPAIPQASGPPPPKYCARPLKLLSDCEYRFKMMVFRRRHAPKSNTRRAAPADPLDTPYAACYRKLIQFTETNGIHLALANFSMAVNKNSDPKVIEFYRSAFESIYLQMQANEIHSKLIKELAAQHPDICLIDTHPNLDGEYQKFIDPIHFTQEGRLQLAENIFAGIRPILEKDLASRN